MWVLKPRNSWSQQSVHHFIRGHEYEQLDSHWDPGDASVSWVSVAVLVMSAWCCSGKLGTVASFKLKAHAKNPVLNSNGVQRKAHILKTISLSLFTAQLRASCHVTCLRLPQWRLLEKEEYYALILERQGSTFLSLTQLMSLVQSRVLAPLDSACQTSNGCAFSSATLKMLVLSSGSNERL